MLHLIDTRKTGQKMDNLILEFKRRYNRAKQKEMELPQALLAFKLLDAAQAEQKDRQTVDSRYKETRVRNFQAQLFGKFVQRSACLSQNIQQN